MKFATIPVLACLAVALATPVLAAPNDPSRFPVCSSFAKAALKWNNMAKSMGCKLPGSEVKQTEASKFKWCMGTNDADFRVRSPQAAGHRAGLQKHCQKQHGEYFTLN